MGVAGRAGRTWFDVVGTAARDDGGVASRGQAVDRAEGMDAFWSAETSSAPKNQDLRARKKVGHSVLLVRGFVDSCRQEWGSRPKGKGRSV